MTSSNIVAKERKSVRTNHKKSQMRSSLENDFESIQNVYQEMKTEPVKQLRNQNRETHRFNLYFHILHVEPKIRQVKQR